MSANFLVNMKRQPELVSRILTHFLDDTLFDVNQGVGFWIKSVHTDYESLILKVYGKWTIDSPKEDISMKSNGTPDPLYHGENITIAYAIVQHVEKHWYSGEDHTEENLKGYIIVTRQTTWNQEVDFWNNNVYLTVEAGEKFIDAWGAWLMMQNVQTSEERKPKYVVGCNFDAPEENTHEPPDRTGCVAGWCTEDVPLDTPKCSTPITKLNTGALIDLLNARFNCPACDAGILIQLGEEHKATDNPPAEYRNLILDGLPSKESDSDTLKHKTDTTHKIEESSGLVMLLQEMNLPSNKPCRVRMETKVLLRKEDGKFELSDFKVLLEPLTDVELWELSHR